MSELVLVICDKEQAMRMAWLLHEKDNHTVMHTREGGSKVDKIIHGDTIFKIFEPTVHTERIQAYCPVAVIVHKDVELTEVLLNELHMRLAPRSGRIRYEQF
jgi:prophage tail gpP-like protein